MFMALASFVILLTGVSVATRHVRGLASASLQMELIGGGLLATGFMLLGAGLQSASG